MNAGLRMTLALALAGGLVGACTGAPSLSLTDDRCIAEWNSSPGPEALAALMESAPVEASMNLVSAHRNESGIADCVLLALTETSALLGVLSDDGDVQVVNVPPADGKEMVELGEPVVVSNDGTVSLP